MSYTVRRIVTGHDGDGRAVVSADDALHSRVVMEGYEPVEIWCTGALPAVNGEDTRADGSPGAPGSRAMLRIGELAPGHRSPLHRSRSLDYGICIEGECELHLDGGEVVRVAAGDVVIQRGTNHAWHNSSQAPVRFAWILIDAEPIAIGGVELPEVMPGDHDVLADWKPDAMPHSARRR